MFRIFVTLCLVVGAVPTLAGETLRIGLQRTGTFAWQLDVIRRHGLASQRRTGFEDQRVCFPGCGQACT
jgi:NitT/TauT family transport system substrate-binding protein